MLIPDKFILSCPSKSFLLGEYSVTQGGEALMACVQPRFKLTIERADNLEMVNIPDNSPANHFIQRHANLFNSYKLIFFDPYLQFQKIGGFGASSAQFLLSYWAKMIVISNQINLPEPKLLLDHYLEFAWHGKGIKPSGVDLLAQLTGGLCYVNRKTLQIKKLSWPFANAQFHLLATRNKQPTHEHLTQLNQTNDFSKLKTIFSYAKNAWEKSDLENFAKAVCSYQMELQKYCLVDLRTIALIDQLKKAIKNKIELNAVKGCGALGTDVLFLLTMDQNAHKSIEAFCNQRKLYYLATNGDLSEGAKVDFI